MLKDSISGSFDKSKGSGRNQNPNLAIEQVDPSLQSVRDEKSGLVRISERHRGLIYLDDNHAQFLFFARLGNVDDLVGYCSLRSYLHDPTRYGISYMAHPLYENIGVASSLAAHAVGFAQKTDGIERIFAHV